MSTTQWSVVPPAAGDIHRFDDLRKEVRDFLSEMRDDGLITPDVDSWLVGWDEEFSRRLAARGWLGMTIPAEYGGNERSFLERFVVTEELLAAGAPVAAHWIADRQIVPSLLKYGNDIQKSKYLPAIARGECFFGIGMSEPEAGSDLAAVRTKATRVDGGWSVTGTKLWTSGAHRADAFICLARTSPVDLEHRHDGLSQFIIDLRSPGVDIRPILSMDGRHHFNEVILDDVYISDDMLFGTVGNGWTQVTSELGFERSGPERFLSTAVLLAETAEQMSTGAVDIDAGVGRLTARLAGLHHMSMAVAGALERREPVDVSAAVVKVLGTATEGDIADMADIHYSAGEQGESFRSLVDSAVAQRPGFTLRGGTSQVLHGVIARGLGIR